MTEFLLSWLAQTTWLAILGSLLWGMASVLLSPCHLTSLPLLVGFLGRLPGQPLASPYIAAWVTAGISLSLIIIAAVSLSAGRILGDLWGIGPWLTIIFLILAGLLLLDVIQLPSLAQLRPERARTGALGAAGAGGILGVTLGPCSFAFFAPLLAIGAGESSLTMKVSVLGAFIFAHLLATWVVGLVGAKIAGWGARQGRAMSTMKAILGVIVIALAIELIITAP